VAVPGSPAEKKPTLGLDLQGGLEVVLKAVPPKGHKLTSEDIDRSIDIMRKRIDKLGVSEPEIRKQGTNQIVIQLAGVHNAGDAAKLIGKTAQLEFSDFEGDLTGKTVNSQTYFYLLKHRVDLANPIPEMTGAELKLSGTRADFDTQSGQPIVLMQFTGKGKKIFHEITKREAVRGALRAQGQSG